MPSLGIEPQIADPCFPITIAEGSPGHKGRGEQKLYTCHYGLEHDFMMELQPESFLDSFSHSNV
jgi:hypothetical protein